MKKIWFCAGSFTLLLAVFCTGLSGQELPDFSIQKARSGIVPGSAEMLIDIMRSPDALVGKSRDEKQVAFFLRNKNNRVIDYLVSRYPQYGAPDVDVNDPAATWFGLLCAMYEAYQFKPLKRLAKNCVTEESVPAWLCCCLRLVGEDYGMREAVERLETFSFEALWEMARLATTKYTTGWRATARVISEMTKECF